MADQVNGQKMRPSLTICSFLGIDRLSADSFPRQLIVVNQTSVN